jgi:hypothetical protein
VGTADPTGFLKKSVNVIFTTSPAGLGHIRVTDALISGMPNDIDVEVIGVKDESVKFLHRLTSTNKFLRKVTEFIQNEPLFEDIFARFYRNFLAGRSRKLSETIFDLIKSRSPKPKVLLIVSTHFGLAHKIARIKEELAEKLGLCVILCVVVTDDSPQKVWAVGGADFIFVPSTRTKMDLERYLAQLGPNSCKVNVCPYPVYPSFLSTLSRRELLEKEGQVLAKGAKNMEIIIPVSGAAVGLDYLRKIISGVSNLGGVDVTIVSRRSGYTESFLRWVENISFVKVISSTSDSDVVRKYERAVVGNLFSLEITKPSEQAFKALISPSKKGGLILLFSEPVGRQEYDNLDFLKRHGLMPGESDCRVLDKIFQDEPVRLNKDFLTRARSWRCISLPKDGYSSARAIIMLRKRGILESMMNFSGFPDSLEVRDDGVEFFWKSIGELTHKMCRLRIM